MKKNGVGVYFPLLINVQKFPCLVVGGGTIAGQKVSSLLNFNADVTVISPKVSKFISNLSKKGEIKLIKHAYSKKFIREYKIVFCATNNPQINKTVHNDCTQEGILINVADNPPLCDFILPANIKRGDLTISVSSQGRAPFFAKEIKKKIEHIFSPSYKDIIDLAGNFRSIMMNNKKYNSPKMKETAFMKFFMVDWKRVLDNEGKKKANEYLRNILDSL